MSVTLLNSAATISALVALSTSGLLNNEVVEVANYARAGDLGGGPFMWLASSVAVTDSGITFCPTANITVVTSELLGTGDGSTVTFSGHFSRSPIQPGSVAISAGSVSGTDSGSYGIIAGAGISGTIQYPSGNGAWSVTFAAAPAAGQSILASYNYMAAGRWIRQFTGPVQDVFFGVIGNYNGTSGNDDTAALQAAINYCANNTENRGSSGSWWKPLLLPPTGGARYVTASLNATLSLASTTAGHFKIIGESAVIYGKLTSAYPILDLSGNNYCEIDDLTVFSAGGAESVSVLLAATSFYTQGGSGSTFNRLSVNLGLAIINADLVTINEPSISNSIGWGLLAVTDNPTGLASAYQTITSTVTSNTLITVYGGQIQSSCPTTGVIWHDLNGTLYMDGVHVAPTGATGTRPSTIRIGNNLANAKQLVMSGSRLRNQSSQASLPAIQTYGGNTGQVISLAVSGLFNLGASDSVFDLQPGNATVQLCTFDNLVVANGGALITQGSQVTNFRGQARFNCPVCTGTQVMASGSAGFHIVGATPSNMAAFVTANSAMTDIHGVDSNGTIY